MSAGYKPPTVTMATNPSPFSEAHRLRLQLPSLPFPVARPSLNLWWGWGEDSGCKTLVTSDLVSVL